jgi:hypothetical protein
MVAYMLRHNPAPGFGFVLLFTFAVLFAHIQFKIREVGYQTYPMFARPRDCGLPMEYLKVRAKYGWSPWPAYLVWPCLAAGIILLVAGVMHLAD